MKALKGTTTTATLGAVAILCILSTSSGVTALSSASASAGDANWTGPDNNFPLNWNYDNQTVINSQNVADLQVKWTFPVPSAPPGQISTAEGVMVTPLIYEGVVYGVTNWNRVYALNSDNGDVLWYVDLPIMDN